jgi:hypothetical protein
MKDTEKKCFERDNVIRISIDFVQNFPLPNIPVQEVVYFRQLCFLEFTASKVRNQTFTYIMGVLAGKAPTKSALC